LGTPALYMPKGMLVDVIQDGEEMAFVKFSDGKAIWVKSNDLDFDNLVDDATADALDDDWGPENDDTLGFDDDFEIDSGDHYDFEYDRL